MQFEIKRLYKHKLGNEQMNLNFFQISQVKPNLVCDNRHKSDQ